MYRTKLRIYLQQHSLLTPRHGLPEADCSGDGFCWTSNHFSWPGSINPSPEPHQKQSTVTLTLTKAASRLPSASSFKRITTVQTAKEECSSNLPGRPHQTGEARNRLDAEICGDMRSKAAAGEPRKPGFLSAPVQPNRWRPSSNCFASTFRSPAPLSFLSAGQICRN